MADLGPTLDVTSNGHHTDPAAGNGATDLILPEDVEYFRHAAVETVDRDRLRAAYHRFFFTGDAPTLEWAGYEDTDDDEEEDDDEPKAIGSRDGSIDRADLARLKNDDDTDDDDDEAGVLDFDRISENEERERAEQNELAEAVVDDEFMSWVNGYDASLDVAGSADTRAAQHGAPLHGLSAKSLVDQELLDRGMTQLQPSAVEGVDAAPPRLAKLVALGRVPEAIVPDEPGWVLDQLRRPGYPLYGLRVSEPMAFEVARGIDLMSERMFEPATIAMLFRDNFPELRLAVWSNHATRGSPADAAMSMSTTTGRRVVPREHPTSGPFVDGADDVEWGSEPEVVLPKPCDVRLGRLMYLILELATQCRGLQLSRLRTLATLDAAAAKSEEFEPSAKLLKSAVYTGGVDSTVWRTYTDWVLGAIAATNEETGLEDATPGESKPRTLHADVIRSGQYEALRQFCVAPSIFGAALEARTTNLIKPLEPTKNSEVRAWAAEKIRAKLSDEEAEKITPQDVKEWLRQLQSAVAEELAFTPQLRLAAFRQVMNDGTLHVRHIGTGTARGEKVFSIPSILERNPLAALELFESEAAGTVHLRVELPVDLANTLKLQHWAEASYGATCVGKPRDSWQSTLNDVARRALGRLRVFLEPHVRAELRHAAETQYVWNASIRMGHLCAEGGYDPATCLKIPQVGEFVQDKDLWNAMLNAVETVPTNLIRPRVTPVACGVFRAADKTYFCVVDENGSPKVCATWVDYNTASDEGRAAQYDQETELYRVYCDYRPSVFGIAVSGPDAQRTMRLVRGFLRNRVRPSFHVAVDSVYVSSTVPIVAARSDIAEADLQGVPGPARVAAAVAQYLQDPLLAITQLFDTKHTARDLPVGTDKLRQSGINATRVYEWLRHEVTLWVSGSGLDLNAVVCRAHPEAPLACVAGFGPHQARALAAYLQAEGRVESREDLCGVLAGKLELSGEILLNVVPKLRIFPYATPEGRLSLPHPLDCTLIPIDTYLAVNAAVRNPDAPNSLDLGHFAIADFLLRDFYSRMESIDHEGLRKALVTLAKDASGNLYDPYHSELGPNDEYSRGEFLQAFLRSELVRAGVVTMTRAYRKMSEERFFELSTNLTVRSRPVDAAEAPRIGDRVLYPGREVEGMLRNVVARQSDSSELRVALTVALSLGISGTIALEDIKNVAVAEALRAAVEEFKNMPAGKTATVRPNLGSLQYGEPVFGRILSVNCARCEARLEWMDARMKGEAATPQTLGGDTTRATEVGTVNTRQLLRHALNTAMGFVRHPLFYDLEKDQIIAKLNERPIGEVLLRRSRAGGRHFVISVRVAEEGGEASILSIPAHETRGTSGGLFYRVDDPDLVPGLNVEFESVDHILVTLVEKLVKLALNVRTHRKFAVSSTMAANEISKQISANPQCLAYVVMANPRPSRHSHYMLRVSSKDSKGYIDEKIYFRAGGLGWRNPVGGMTIHKDIHQVVALMKDKYRAPEAKPRSIGRRSSSVASGGLPTYAN